MVAVFPELILRLRAQYPEVLDGRITRHVLVGAQVHQRQCLYALLAQAPLSCFAAQGSGTNAQPGGVMREQQSHQ